MNSQVECFCKLIKNIIHPQSACRIYEPIDWSYMVKMAKEQNLLPIFMEEAATYQSYLVRNEYPKEMQEVLVTVTAQTKRTHAFLTLYKSFVEAQVYPIVMKGLICRELYGQLCDHRPSGDEDIFVHSDDYWKAKQVLIANGYVPEFEGETEAQLTKLQEVSFVHPTEKMCIELHLNPMGREDVIRSQMSDYFVARMGKYREVLIQGVQIRTLCHQEHLLFLILHAFKHFTGGGFGIRQMLDILMYQEQYETELDLSLLYETLHSFRADTFWSDIIHIGNNYFGFDLPVMQDANCPQELLNDAVFCGVFGNTTQAQRTAARTTKFVMGDVLENKDSHLGVLIWKSLFPTKEYLLSYAPYLEEKPWMLPVEWVKRMGRFLKKNKDHDANLAIESIKISQRRIKILKKYNLE